VVSALGVTLSTHAQADSLRPTGNNRLITLYDQGQEKSFLTRATTLDKALDGAHIRVDPSDLVEPALDSQLVASSYEVNIYRARPVTIVDGSTRKRVLSPYQTAKQIVEHAGIVLHDEDKMTMTMNNDIVGDGSSVELTIDRATPFTLKLYGKIIPAYTQSATVGDMLKEKDITLAKGDQLALPASQLVVAGMTVEIWHNGTQTFTQDEPIAAPVRQVQNADQPVGYKQVQTPGKDGKKTVTYEINMVNGQEVSRTVIQSVVIEQPQEQVVVIGTKLSLPVGSHEDWMSAAGTAASDFGYANAIFAQESGWNPASRSSAGYVGLGQTSETTLSAACLNWQVDPICQIRFFNGYAAGRYGSWHGAYIFKFGDGTTSGHGWW
jgi:uncharacterized protein YabE (DUF348 family)